MKKLIPAALITAFTVGCASQGYNLNSNATAGAEPDHQESQHFFVSGIGQAKNIDAAKICGGADKVVRVESHESPTNVFLGVVTLGIYTLRDVRVFCSK